MEGLVSIKNNLVGGLGSIISYLNPNSDNFILSPVIDGLNNLKEMFVLLLDYLNPFSENFFLKIALVPRTTGYQFKNNDSRVQMFSEIQPTEYELKKQELIDSFTQKFIFYDNILDAFEQIENLSEGSATAPTFKVTVPQKYGGGTYSIIDFSMFTDYRVYVLNFSRCIMWFFFIKGIFRSLPKTTSLQ